MKHLLDSSDVATIWREERWRIGGDNPDPLMNHQLELAIAQAQYDLLLSKFPKNEDIRVMLFQYTQGERTLESVVEYIKRGTFGDAE